MPIPDALLPRLDLFHNEPRRYQEPLQGQEAVNAAFAAAELRARQSSGPIGRLIDQLASDSLAQSFPNTLRAPTEEQRVRRPGQTAMVVAASFQADQLARIRARYQLGLEIAPHFERQFRYEGVEGQGRFRLDTYAAYSPKQLGKMEKGTQSALVAAVVVGGRMGLADADYDVVQKLLEMRDQGLATCLAAVHPDRLRKMFAEGISQDPHYADQLPALIKQWAAEDGPYTKPNRLEKLFGAA